MRALKCDKWKTCGLDWRLEGVGKDMEKWNPPAGWEEVSEKTGKSTQASFQWIAFLRNKLCGKGSRRSKADRTASILIELPNISVKQK